MRKDTKERVGFLARFFGGILVLYFVLALKPVDRAVVEPFTNAIGHGAAAVLRLIGEEVTAHDTLLISPGFAVGLKNGCNGLEAMLLLGAAVLATRGDWSARVKGFVFGTLLIQAANLVRVVTLFLAGRRDRELFDLLHTTVWQAVIFLIAISYFVAWNVKFAKPRRATTS